MQEQLARVAYYLRKVITMPWTYADVVALEQIAVRARAEFTAQPPVVEPPPPPPPPPPAPITEFIVDALPAGARGQSPPGSVDFTGTWTTSTTAGKWNNTGLYSGTKPTPDATPLSTYTFRSPPLPKSCDVSVYVWWAQFTNRSQTVPITAGGVTKTFNQQTQGSQWVLHGTYPCMAGDQVPVTISNANGQAAADAVRFVLE
jgi:hypothetical protein